MKKFFKETLKKEVKEFVEETGLFNAIAIVAIFVVGIIYIFAK